jgi:hypothetical protein
MNNSDGMNYAPRGKPSPVVKPGEFIFAAAHLDHGHIQGQCNGLVEAGGILKWIYDSDPKKVEGLQKNHPGAKLARSLDEILDDPEVRMVTAAAIPCERGPIGCRVIEAEKDYFTDKCPFTSLDQLARAKEVVGETGRKYMVYFSERLHVECAVFAGDLVRDGVIGRVIQVLGLGPHRLSASSRPGWFFEKAKYGGILCDIGSHQIEQFLHFSSTPERKMPPYSTRPSPILTIPITPSWRTSVKHPSSQTTERPIIFAWIGLRPRVYGPGEMGAPSSWERKAISSCESILMWAARARRATT